MRVKIEVTKKDICRGRRHSCSRCPIARAVRRVVKRGLSVEVAATVEIGRRNVDSPYLSALPLEAFRFVRKFDIKGRQAVEPFTFTLNIPKAFLR